jgi:hypothetical protein
MTPLPPIDGHHPELSAQDIAFIESAVRARGPNRVLLSRDGHAVGPERAHAAGVIPDVILVRQDGWTLGCPLWLESAARALWADAWVYSFRLTH